MDTGPSPPTARFDENPDYRAEAVLAEWRASA